MKNKFLGFICIFYSIIIFYVWIFDKMKNYLAVSLHFNLKLAGICIFIFGILFLISKGHNKFKFSDLILLLPILFLIISNNSILGSKFASERVNYKTEGEASDVSSNVVYFDDSGADFSDVYFEIEDSSYESVSMNLTSSTKAVKFEGKTIRLRGMAILDTPYLSDTDFMVGKYVITCCAADAGFNGFVIRFDRSKIEDSAWYEIEGVLHKGYDASGYQIMIVNAVNVKKIDSSNEELYVYPCYSYGSHACEKISSYKLEY